MPKRAPGGSIPPLRIYICWAIGAEHCGRGDLREKPRRHFTLDVGRSPMPHHPHLDQLAGDLFQVFSRTEYALKASGFNNGDGPAEPNWRAFALTVEAVIANPPSPELKEAIEFFFYAPPKKQVIVGGVIGWEVSEPPTDSRADMLLLYVRRVRNNLFHGGKFNRHWFEPERSEPLLRHSVTILQACVEAVPVVQAAYHG